MPQDARDRIVVIGIGNPLKLDEGVGVRIAEELLTWWDLGGAADIVDAGTMGMSMLPLFQEYDVMIVADAVDGTGHDPGTVLLMTPAEVAPNQVMHSLHDIRFPDVLAAAELIGCSNDITIVGVQIERMSEDAQLGLTPLVEEAVPRAVDAVLEILEGYGVAAERRVVPSRDGAMLAALRLGTEMPDLSPPVEPGAPGADSGGGPR